MAEIVTALITYGPLGIFCAILWVAYQKEKRDREKDVKELNNKIQELLEKHANNINDIRKSQTDRERHFAEQLSNYGNSIVNAVDQTHQLAERIIGI